MKEKHFIPLDEIGMHEEKRECDCEPKKSKIDGEVVIFHNCFGFKLLIKEAERINQIEGGI